ncbi:hypothetical protein POM88_006170 [Heracleum sosnowskyi]|uniref:Uncharacterized protein n=1 Tax=Heracleum sosnowskyi TaxID=360622 RepID=A0AAD8J265_9APIA|nr:hypothetical protein POM88_006170 [Heracleum sosnowskyi]
MGYPRQVVFKAVQQHREDDEEAVLNTILTYTSLETSMGFPFVEKFRNIERCGIETQIEDLVDSIHAAKTEKEDDIQGLNCVGMKRKHKKQKSCWTYKVDNYYYPREFNDRIWSSQCQDYNGS